MHTRLPCSIDACACALQVHASSLHCHDCRSIPGFVSEVIYSRTIKPGWTFQPYSTKDTRLLAAGQGVGGGTALCSSISQGGALAFICRECSRPGYQPFAKAQSLQMSIRSNTKSLDPFASSTPPGQLPPLKIFMMNVSVLCLLARLLVLLLALLYNMLATCGQADWAHRRYIHKY